MDTNKISENAVPAKNNCLSIILIILVTILLISIMNNVCRNNVYSFFSNVIPPTCEKNCIQPCDLTKDQTMSSDLNCRHQYNVVHGLETFGSDTKQLISSYFFPSVVDTTVLSYLDTEESALYTNLNCINFFTNVKNSVETYKYDNETNDILTLFNSVNPDKNSVYTSYNKYLVSVNILQFAIQILNSQLSMFLFLIKNSSSLALKTLKNTELNDNAEVSILTIVYTINYLFPYIVRLRNQIDVLTKHFHSDFAHVNELTDDVIQTSSISSDMIKSISEEMMNKISLMTIIESDTYSIDKYSQYITDNSNGVFANIIGYNSYLLSFLQPYSKTYNNTVLSVVSKASKIVSDSSSNKVSFILACDLINLALSCKNHTLSLLNVTTQNLIPIPTTQTVQQPAVQSTAAAQSVQLAVQPVQPAVQSVQQTVQPVQQTVQPVQQTVQPVQSVQQSEVQQSEVLKSETFSNQICWPNSNYCLSYPGKEKFSELSPDVYQNSYNTNSLIQNNMNSKQTQAKLLRNNEESVSQQQKRHQQYKRQNNMCLQKRNNVEHFSEEKEKEKNVDLPPELDWAPPALGPQSGKASWDLRGTIDVPITTAPVTYSVRIVT